MLRQKKKAKWFVGNISFGSRELVTVVTTLLLPCMPNQSEKLKKIIKHTFLRDYSVFELASKIL